MQLIDPKFVTHLWMEGVITRKTMGVRNNDNGRKGDPYCTLEFVFATLDERGNQTLKTQTLSLTPDYGWNEYEEGQVIRLPIRVSAYGAIGARLSIKVEPYIVLEADEKPADDPKRPFYPQREAAE
jgi:hypothetical protein